MTGRANCGRAIASPIPVNDPDVVPTFEPEPWRQDALCAQTDPDAFFPEKGGSTDDAKLICGRCEVAAQCLAYALANNERHGVWGGLSERERKAYRTNPDGKTHCIRGHEYTEENTYRTKKGRKQCRKCATTLKAAKYRAEGRAS